MADDLASILAELQAVGLHQPPQPRMATSWQDLAGFAGSNTGMLGYSPGGAAGPGNLPSLQNPPIPMPAQMGFRPPAMPATGGAMPNPAEAADIRSSANAAAGLGDVGSLFVGGPVGRGLNYGLGLMDLLGGQAQAGERDPRAVRIDRLNASVAENQKKLQSFATQNFRSTKARSDATQPLLDAIKSDQAEAARLQGQLDDEFKQANDLRIAEERGAAWRNTPTARAYPPVEYASTALGGLGSAYLAFRGARGPVRQFNERLRSIVARQKAAIDQANDATLSAAVRNQARRTAQAAEADYQAAVAGQPRLSLGDRGLAFLGSGAGTDVGLMAPTFADYAYSFQDPMGPLHSESASQMNPLENPGRFGAGFLGGGMAGVLGQEIGERFPGVQIPPGYGAETAGLPARYASPRKPAAPRRRK
jgi:hypothetical protein